MLNTRGSHWSGAEYATGNWSEGRGARRDLQGHRRKKLAGVEGSGQGWRGVGRGGRGVGRDGGELAGVGWEWAGMEGSWQGWEGVEVSADLSTVNIEALKY